MDKSLQPGRLFRWATADDYDVLADIMFDAVRNGESLYSESQRQAWVSERRSGPEWIARLQGQDIVIAEQDGRPVGFMSLAAAGYVDFAYIRPEAQRSGLFRQLLTRIEQAARLKKEPRLWTHASLMAEPAFESLGFIVTRREQVTIGSEIFDRCEMEKRLPDLS